MTERHCADPVERAELTEQDLAIATLIGRYIERRDHAETPCVHDLLGVSVRSSGANSGAPARAG